MPYGNMYIGKFIFPIHRNSHHNCVNAHCVQCLQNIDFDVIIPCVNVMNILIK